MQKTLQFFCGISVAVILELLRTKKERRSWSSGVDYIPKNMSASPTFLQLCVLPLLSFTHARMAGEHVKRAVLCLIADANILADNGQRRESSGKNRLTLTPPSPSHSHSVLSLHLHCAPERRKDVGGPKRRHVTLSCGTASDSSHGRHWNGKRRLMLRKDGLNVRRLDICSSKHTFWSTTNHTRSQLLCNCPTASTAKEFLPGSVRCSPEYLSCTSLQSDGQPQIYS